MLPSVHMRIHLQERPVTPNPTLLYGCYHGNDHASATLIMNVNMTAYKEWGAHQFGFLFVRSLW